MLGSGYWLLNEASRFVAQGNKYTKILLSWEEKKCFGVGLVGLEDCCLG